MNDVDTRTNGRHQQRDGRVPPNDTNAERALLGAMLLTRDAIDAAHDHGVTAADFYRPAHAHIYTAISALRDAGDPVDTVTVAALLGATQLLEAAGGPGELVDLQADTPSTSSAGHYSRLVRDLALLRRLIAAAGEIAELGYSRPDDAHAAIDRAETLIAALTTSTRPGDTLRELNTVLDDHLSLLEQRVEGSITDGATTGLVDLDDIIGGLRPGQLIIGAGRPGMGKTALGLQLAANTAAVGNRVLFTSIEMSEIELADRMLAAAAGVAQTRIRTGSLAAKDWPHITSGYARLGTLPIAIHDAAGATLARIRSRAQRLPGLNLIVVDYLQIVDPGGRGENRQNDVAELSRGLKRLARDLHVPVVALAQLNRSSEGRQEKRPMLADLRDSGQIEQDADVVIGLYRDEVYKPDTKDRGVLEAIVLKNRSGRLDTARLAFNTNTQRINDLVKEM